MSQEIIDLVDMTIKRAIENTSNKDLTADKINAIARLINTRNRLMETALINGKRPGIPDEDPNLYGDPAYVEKLFAECKARSPKCKSKQ